MTPIKAYEIFTTDCRYTLTVYRTGDGCYLAEYCAHKPDPGPLVRVGDLQPAGSSLGHHQDFYVQSLLKNCLSEITRESGTVEATRETPVHHVAPGHECQNETA